ncbi:MAG: hypothetical protein M3548_21495, partial [Actinomycetota bacterium]|nr:hypothetical protein [Actinomycetota bacterium]
MGGVPDDRVSVSQVPGRLWAALGLATAGGVLLAVGPVAGVVAHSPAPGFSAQVLLVLLAAVVPLTAVGFIVTGRAVVAGGVLVGAALSAPGRALLDLQFAADGLLASRPEIMVPTSLAPLRAGLGLWLLLGGHMLVALAGLLAAGRAGAVPGDAYAAEFDDRSADRSARAQRVSLLLALIAGTVAAVGLVLSPFTSDNAFQLADDVFASPPLARYGV